MSVRKKPIKKEPKKSVAKKKHGEKWMDEYRHLYTQKRMPISVLYLEALAKDLMDWGYNEDALILQQFYDEKGIEPTLPFDCGWFDRCPALKAAHACARRFIGYRRELGMMRGKLSVSATLNQQVKYDHTWKKVEEWRNDLKVKAKEDQQANVFNIYATNKTTPKVLEKKESVGIARTNLSLDASNSPSKGVEKIATTTLLNTKEEE